MASPGPVLLKRYTRSSKFKLTHNILASDLLMVMRTLSLINI